MATIQFVETKGKLEKVFIKNATLMYVKTRKAYPIYSQKDLPTKSQTMFEYTVDLVVDEDVADQYDEQFPKQSSKKLLKAAFMKQYKIESDADFPEGLDPKAKKFFVIKVKQNTHYEKDGKPVALSASTRPKVIAVVDGKKEDITVSKDVSNGSIGDVLLTVNHNKQYGASAKLKGILVTTFIEYEASGGDKDLVDFFGDDVEFAELPEEVEVNTPSSSDEGDFEDDVPFELDDEEDDF